MGNNSSSQRPLTTQDTSFLSRAQLRLAGTPSRLGLRVLRGPNWTWGNKDGGLGSVGTLIAVDHPSSDEAALSPVWVAWDNGAIQRYRTSRTGPCDLRLYDSGPAGVETCFLYGRSFPTDGCSYQHFQDFHSKYHAWFPSKKVEAQGTTWQLGMPIRPLKGIHFPNVTCDACSKAGIGGTRWKCSQCFDYELCHACYMADKHNLEHAFLRYDAPGATGIKVNARKGSVKLNVRGIFEGAKVVCGPHWKGGNEDAEDFTACTDGIIGTVLSVRDHLSGTVRSRVRVLWSGADVDSYSVGHGGGVALKCVQSAAGGPVYVDHMPLIGPVQIKKDDCGGEFFMGARVGVTLDVDTFRLLQHGLGEWVPELVKVINKIGVVQDVTARGDVRVCYGSSTRWSISPAALLKVPTFSVGDRVRVVEDLPTVESLEDDDRVAFEPRTKVLGRTGIVTQICSSQDVRVNVDGCDAVFNPLSLAPVPRLSNEAGPSQIAARAVAPSSTQAQEALVTRLHELEVARRCPICMDRQRDVLFMCGHGCCDACSQNLRLCHVCRKDLTNKIPIY